MTCPNCTCSVCRPSYWATTSSTDIGWWSPTSLSEGQVLSRPSRQIGGKTATGLLVGERRHFTFSLSGLPRWIEDMRYIRWRSPAVLAFIASWLRRRTQHVALAVRRHEKRRAYVHRLRAV